MFEEGIDVIYADGYAMTKKEKKNSPETYIADAVEAAKKADVAVLFIGLTDEFESEGFDRTHLRIPPEHVALLSAIRGVTENIVVVLAGGAVVEMPWIGEAKALLNSYLGGEASGSAVTDILSAMSTPPASLPRPIRSRSRTLPATTTSPDIPLLLSIARVCISATATMTPRRRTSCSRSASVCLTPLSSTATSRSLRTASRIPTLSRSPSR